MAFDYILRGIGDTGREIISKFSFLGLPFFTGMYVYNNWWPLSAMLLFSIFFSFLAVTLNKKRDLGAGFIAARSGKVSGGITLRNNFGLIFRLLKNQIISWGIGMFILGAAYGSVLGEMDTFFEIDLFQQILASETGTCMMEAFLTFIMIIFAIVATVGALVLVLKIRNEEKNGRLEAIFARDVKKTNALLGYAFYACLSGVIYLFMIACGMYLAGSLVMESPFGFTTLLIASLVYLPALWIIVGLSVSLIGWLPKLTGIAWAYLGAAFMIVYLGRMLGFDDWILKLIPFGHVAAYPTEDVDFTIMGIKVALAIALIVLGLTGYKNRDVNG